LTICEGDGSKGASTQPGANRTKRTRALQDAAPASCSGKARKQCGHTSGRCVDASAAPATRKQPQPRQPPVRTVTRGVDDGRPVRGVGVALVHERARLAADLVASGIPQGAVERRGGRDGERRVGGPGRGVRVGDVGDAVRRLRPPIVRGQAHAVQGGSARAQGRDLVRQRQAGDDVCIGDNQAAVVGSWASNCTAPGGLRDAQRRARRSGLAKQRRQRNQKLTRHAVIDGRIRVADGPIQAATAGRRVKGAGGAAPAASVARMQSTATGAATAGSDVAVFRGFRKFTSGTNSSPVPTPAPPWRQQQRSSSSSRSN